MKKNAKVYFAEYLKVAPLSLAIWRAVEAEAVSKVDYSAPVLDLGCGFGEFAGVVFDRIVEVGVDISQKDIVIAGKRKKYKKLILADARNLPFRGQKFGTVFSISTLEHISDPKKVFHEVYRVLKPGGTFIFTVPTKELNKELVFPVVELFHWTFKHKVLVGKKEWLDMARNAGFKIEYCEGTTSSRQIRAFELTLPLALPTQLFRRILGRRLLCSPNFRIRLCNYLFQNLFDEDIKTEANIIVVVKK